MNTIAVAIPYAKRHLQTEIKQRGGKFQATDKTWLLPDNPDNRQLAEIIQKPIAGPTAQERVTNVIATSVELLNALKYRCYRASIDGDKIVIESDPLVP